MKNIEHIFYNESKEFSDITKDFTNNQKMVLLRILHDSVDKFMDE